MIKKTAKAFSIVIAAVMMFTGAYILAGDDTSATIRWSKVTKNVKGYTVYKNGKAVKTVGTKVTSYRDASLQPETSYSFSVRAYNTAKKKQWYNKKTKKWQSKKPPRKYRGKSKKMTVKLYGSAAGISFTTLKKIVPQATFFGITVKDTDCPYSFSDVDFSTCPKCQVKSKASGTITYSTSTGKFNCNYSGTDYSKQCHHCNSIELYKYCKKEDKTRYFTKEGEILADGSIDENQTIESHHSNDENKCQGYIKDGDNIINFHFTNNNGNWIYCFDCKTHVYKPDDLPAGWPDHKH